MKSLIVYDSLTNGNTKRIAEMLQQATQADIAEIQTVTPYTGGYDAVVAQGQEEVNRGYEPEIQPLSVSVADYDRIFIGTPTWWYTMAPAVRTFLHQQNFSGKTVIPFMTNGGWPGHVIEDMIKECKGAEIVKPMEIKFDSQGGPVLKTSEDKINAWIAEIKRNL